MSHVQLAASQRHATNAAASWPGSAQRHTRIRSLPAAHAQPNLRARNHRHTFPAWPSGDASRVARRRRAVCRAVRDPGLLHVPGPPKRPDGRFSATWRRLQRSFPILKYEGLLQRVAGTFVLLGLARLGHFLPVDGIDPFMGFYTPCEGRSGGRASQNLKQCTHLRCRFSRSWNGGQASRVQRHHCRRLFAWRGADRECVPHFCRDDRPDPRTQAAHGEAARGPRPRGAL